MNAQTWISEFLFTRMHFKGPTGKPLYAYQVTEEEYSQLVELLKNCRFDTHPVVTKTHYTAACFCLFVSEYYRRFYNSTWSWSGPQQILGIEIYQEDRATLVKRGLDYWGRYVRSHESGYNYLGSLFAEGGLPWTLVGSDQHGFGKAIKRGIKNYYKSEQLRRSLTDLMQDFQHELPQNFRNFETIQLLSGIVEQLMSYAQQIPIEAKKDPAAYLDQSNPGWNKHFPIPLDIANGRQLVNEWLSDAVISDADEKRARELRSEFTSFHQVIEFLPIPVIETTLQLPDQLKFSVAEIKLSTTRFETAVYEGERLVTKSLPVYGQIDNDEVSTRLSVTQIRVKRSDLKLPLVFKLLENGRAVFIHEVFNSSLEIDAAPLVAIAGVSAWDIVATASCQLKNKLVRTFIPSGATIEVAEDSELSRFIVSVEAGQWYEFSTDHAVKTLLDRYSIELDAQSDISPFRLIGEQFYGETIPQTVYLGLPRIEFLRGVEDTLNGYYTFINGVPKNQQQVTAGIVNLQVKDCRGNTLYRRQFGVLPKDFSYSTKAAPINESAKVHFHTNQAVSISSERSDNYEFTKSATERHLFYVVANNEKRLPLVDFKVASLACPRGVLVRLPYPAVGVRLVTPQDELFKGTELLLGHLVGYRLVLNAANQIKEMFDFKMALMTKTGQVVVSVTRKITIQSSTETIGLYGFYQEFVQLLSVVDDQDAYIQLQVSSSRLWFTVNIRRYNASLMKESSDSIAVMFSSFSDLQFYDDDLYAMSLIDPLQQSVALVKRVTQGVPTGLYDTANLNRKPDLWLVYAKPEAKLSFRPLLYITAKLDLQASSTEAETLQTAAKDFHPVHNPQAISRVIKMMSESYHHSGWQYLTALKQNYGHLPLSTFEAWKALAQNPKAVALAIYRLELDEAFCMRLRDELSVLFEAIPLSLWVDVRREFRNVLLSSNIPEVYVQKTIANRNCVMQLVVSGFEHITGYLDSGDVSNLKSLPIEQIVPHWYQDLRRDHASDEHWPEKFKAPLRAWLDSSDLPEFLKALTYQDYTDSVTFLPIYMAYVTTGQASIQGLHENLPLVKYHIKQHVEFDRHWFLAAHALMVAYLTKQALDKR